MQNAIIKYKIRIDKGEDKGREVEIQIILHEFETEWTIADELNLAYGIVTDTWGSEYYTVIERTIEPFNED